MKWMSILLGVSVLTGCASAKNKPSVRISTVSNTGMPTHIVKPGNLWNFGAGSLWTHKGWQYAAYWDDARQVTVGRRKLPEGKWETFSLPDYQRTSTGDRGKGGKKSQGFGDGHEKVAMGISPDGVIHLSFDHHLSTLRYRYTVLPVADNPEKYTWTPELFSPVKDNLGGPQIVSVTYPSFSTDGKHFVLYLRLNGGSGSADSNYFEYMDGKWLINDEASAKLIDKNWSGGDKTVNAYLHGLVFHNGRRYITWCWRDTPNARTCHDLCFAYSDDQGKTWKNNDGKVIGKRGEMPITADSPGVAAIEIPPGSWFQNGGSMVVDSDGRGHVLMQGEKGQPVHFERDPFSGEWSRNKSSAEGKLVVAPKGDSLYIATYDGLLRTSAETFGKTETLVSGKKHYFKDSKMGIDRTRVEQDGWVSVIGQNGKKVTVLDYWIGP